MVPSAAVSVFVDLAVIQAQALAIQRLTGVEVIAVVKADAYGLGAEAITAALAPHVDGFCVFRLAEAQAVRIWERTGRPTIAIGPQPGEQVADYRAAHVRPAVWDAARAAALRQSDPLLSVDTGMQRFACPAGELQAVIKAAGVREAMTHATDLQRVGRLVELVGGRGMKLHAAGSSLLAEPSARLDAVRPGIALYRGAARISTPLVDERASSGPAGYSGFITPRHGVILAGYSNGLRPGPCLLNGRRSRIVEVGMQSSFVQTAPGDAPGDQVILLGDGLTEAEVAADWKTSEHEVLTRLAGTGVRRHGGGA